MNQSQASSCCRALPIPISATSTIENLVEVWEQEKMQLSQGTAVPSCQLCWKDEQSGQISYRQMQSHKTPVNEIQLSVSNACNQMCSYCSPKYSSTWQKNIQQHGNFVKVSTTAQLNLTLHGTRLNAIQWLSQIQNHLATMEDDSVNLTLLGGEPLMQIDFLKQMLAWCDKKIAKLNIITNLVPPNNKFLLWMVNHFNKDKLKIYVSLDAAPDFNHVPRAGFKKNVFDQNLDILLQHQIDFEFQAVVSVLNFFALDSYYKWLATVNKPITLNQLNNPECLNINLIPDKFRVPILNILKSHPVPEFVLHNPKVENLIDLKLKEQYNYLTQYFERTGTDVNTIHAEFNQYWAWLEGKYK